MWHVQWKYWQHSLTCDPIQTDEHSAKLKDDMEQAKQTYVKEKLEREGQIVANRRKQVHFFSTIYSSPRASA